MKQYFDSKVKLDNEAEAAAETIIMKTDQGLEFITSKKKFNDQANASLADSEKNTPEKYTSGAAKAAAANETMPEAT